MAPMNRYPRPGMVSMYRGFSAESPSNCLSRFIAALRLCSKSTNVPSPQIFASNCSRVTSSPGFSSKVSKIWKGCFGKRTREPCLKSSPDQAFTSNGPKTSRALDWGGVTTCPTGDPESL